MRTAGTDHRSGLGRGVLGALALAAGLACAEDSGEPQPEPAAAPEAAAPAPEPLPAAAPATWAGSAACADCHPEATARWRGSHHDLAMQEPVTEAVLGDFDDAVFQDGEVRWTFSRRDDRYLARAEGAEEGEFEIAYTFGADPLQQYLVAFPDGRLQALHVAWDARPAERGGQRWFSLRGEEPAPLGDPLHWRGPAMNWNAMCGDCHSTGFRRGYDLEADRYASSWGELDVGCEACHGPGSRHVEWARAAAAGEPSGAGRGLLVHFDAPTRWVFAEGEPIAQPAGGADVRPAQRREIDTCAPCHSRRARITEAPRADETFLDGYLPAGLEGGLYHDDGQIEDEVYVWGSFVQSRMYAAGVRCSDCHEPHAGTLRAEGNALCGGCHAPERYDARSHHHHAEGSAGASCVSCHMRARTYMSIDARRDHGFHRPRPDLSASLGTPNACQDCHAERGDRWAADAVARWRGGAAPSPHFAEQLQQRRIGGSEAAEALMALVRDEDQPGIARATALAELAMAPRAAPLIPDAARSPDPLLRMAAAAASGALPPRDRVLGMGWLLEDPLRSVRIAAADALAGAPASALSDAKRAALASALAEYRAAQAVAADQPGSHVNLAMLALREGDAEAAEASLETALRVGSHFVPAYVGLAELYAVQERDDEGEPLLLRGLEQTGGAAELHLALGLLRVRQDREAEALEELATAARLAPEQPHPSYVYAVALHSAGQQDQALSVLRDALERHPNEQSLLGALATMARDAGKFGEALAAARQLEQLFPDQPQARALREEIEARRRGDAPGAGAPPAN